jgi:hypothetical protein
VIDFINRLYDRWTSITSLDWAGWNARRGRRLLRDGQQSRGRIVGIRVRHSGDSESSTTRYEWAVDVTPSAGDPYRAGIRQTLQHGDRARLGMDVLVRHDDKSRTIIDWPAMLRDWGLASIDVHEMGWKKLRNPPAGGIDDKTLQKVKGDRAEATLVDATRFELFGMETENWNLAFRANGRDVVAKRDQVPVYARHLLAPGTSLPVGIDGDKVRIDWAAAVEGQPGSAAPPAEAAVRREEPAEVVTAEPALSRTEAIVAAPVDYAVEGVGFDTWVEVEAGLVRDRVRPAEYDAYAESHGVPAGAWPAAQAAWHSRMTSDWTIGARFGEAYQAALKRKRNR